jgi:type IV secretory pathway VirB10-like protein
MRSAGNFSPEWGHLAPVPSFARTARIVLVATAIGATAGAGVVLSLVDRSPEPKGASVSPRAIVTSERAAAAPAASQMSAAPMAPAASPVVPAAPPASPPASSTVAPSEVATQSPNHALVPSQTADQPAAAPSTVANASAQAPGPVTPPENTAPPSAAETSASQANSEPAKTEPHPAAGVAALSEPSATGTAADAPDGGTNAQESASPQKKAKHHFANDKAPFPGLGTFFRRFFVAHAVRPNYSSR